MRVATIGADGGLRDADGRSLGAPIKQAPRFLGYTTPPPPRRAFLSQGTAAKGRARLMAESLSTPAAGLAYSPVKADPEKALYPGRLIFLPTDVSLYSISFRPSQKGMVYLFEVEGPGASSWKEVPIASLASYSVVRAGDDMAIQSGISLPTPKLGNGRSPSALGAQYSADMLTGVMDFYTTGMPSSDDLSNPTTRSTYLPQVLPMALAAASLAIEAVDMSAASYDALAIGTRAFRILAKVASELGVKAVRILNLAAEAESSGKPELAIEAVTLAKEATKDFPLLGALLARAVILDAMNAYYEVTEAPLLAQAFAVRVAKVVSRAEREGGALVAQGKITPERLAEAIQYGKDYLNDYAPREVLFNDSLDDVTKAMRASRSDYLRYNEMLPRLLAENEIAIRKLREGRVAMAPDEYLASMPAHLGGLGTNGGKRVISQAEQRLLNAAAKELNRIRTLPREERRRELERARAAFAQEFQEIFLSGRLRWTDLEVRVSKLGLPADMPNSEKAAKLIESIDAELATLPKGSERIREVNNEREEVISKFSSAVTNVFDALRAESAAIDRFISDVRDPSKPTARIIREGIRFISNRSEFMNISDVPVGSVLGFVRKARAIVGSEPAAIGGLLDAIVRTAPLSEVEVQAKVRELGQVSEALAEAIKKNVEEVRGEARAQRITNDQLNEVVNRSALELKLLESVSEGVKFLELEWKTQEAITTAKKILDGEIPATPEQLANASAQIIAAESNMRAAAGIPQGGTVPAPAPGESPATTAQVNATMDAAAAPAVTASAEAARTVSQATGIPAPTPAPAAAPAPAPVPEPAPTAAGGVPAPPDVEPVPAPVPVAPVATVNAAAATLAADPARVEATRGAMRTWSDSMRKVLDWLKRRTVFIWMRTALEKSFGAFGPRREGVAPFSWANVATAPFRLVRLLWRTKTGLVISGLSALVALSEIFGVTNFFGMRAPVPPDPRRVDPPEPADEPLIPEKYMPIVYIGAGALGVILLAHLLKKDEGSKQPRPAPG